MTHFFFNYFFLLLERVCLKRQPTQPKKAYFVAKTCEVETIQPTPYIDLV